MFGSIRLEKFEACKLNQEAASAWTATEQLVGVSYKPLLYLGNQSVKGTDYFFIAEQTLITNPPQRRVVAITIHSFNGEQELSCVEDVL